MGFPQASGLYKKPRLQACVVRLERQLEQVLVPGLRRVLQDGHGTVDLKGLFWCNVGRDFDLTLRVPVAKKSKSDYVANGPSKP